MYAASAPDAQARRQRYALLLAAIIVVFAIEWIAPPSSAEQVLVSALLGVTLLLALWSAEARRPLLWVATAAVLGVLAVSIAEAAAGTVNAAATRLMNAALVGLAPIAVVMGVVRSLRARRAVTLEAVFGVLSVYLLLGMFLAFTYGSIDRLGEGSFFAGGQAASVSHCLYYSFTTLTTVGYGDLTASSNLGHTLSVLEALLGQIYLVTIVALIVANLGRSRPAAR